MVNFGEDISLLKVYYFGMYGKIDYVFYLSDGKQIK